ncbi:MAG: DUF493 domain-containing protein [Candidatus Marinimicrobia bacterium]|nr:DUF493 domain-containing protein [Candidatus Neomarinimicrobiota bacterium]
MKNIDRKLDIKYPCEWTYKVIGNEYELIIDAINNILSNDNKQNYKTDISKKSKSAKYISVNLDIEVDDEATRVKYYKKLSEHKDIKIVL